MPALAPFTPGSTKIITVAATTANLTLPVGGDQVMISSLSANAIAFVNFGDSTVTVVIPTGTQQAGTPILPGTQTILTVPIGATSIATIGTAANTLYVTRGDGQ